VAPAPGPLDVGQLVLSPHKVALENRSKSDRRRACGGVLRGIVEPIDHQEMNPLIAPVDGEENAFGVPPVSLTWLKTD